MVMHSAIAALLVLLGVAHGQQDTFEFSLDLLASSTGYFKVEGYEGLQPILYMVRGREYTFVQRDSTNWYHPLGFSYFPDGAHEGVDELEEGVGNGEAPVYYIDGELSDLDTYEPQFAYPMDFWMDHEYEVRLTFTDPDVDEIFYFCHIHNSMSARILMVDDEDDIPSSEPTDREFEVELYDLVERSSFDEECGTSLAGPFEPKDGTLESEMCPGDVFICGDEDDSYTRCLHSIDCMMKSQMRDATTIEVSTDTMSRTGAFMAHMIPHHDNAVNMAKILMANPGDEPLDEEVEALIIEIINGQNAQNTFMRAWLRENEVEVAECSDRDAAADSGDNDIPDTALAGLIVLGCAALCASALACFFCQKSKQQKRGAQTTGHVEQHQVNSKASAY